jgi:hypothetical protein
MNNKKKMLAEGNAKYMKFQDVRQLKHGKFGPKCLFLGNSDIQTNKM